MPVLMPVGFPPGLGLAPLLAQFVPAGLALALVLLFGLLSFFLFLLTVSSHPSVSLCFVLTYHLVGKFVELTGLLLIYSRS